MFLYGGMNIVIPYFIRNIIYINIRKFYLTCYFNIISCIYCNII